MGHRVDGGLSRADGVHGRVGQVAIDQGADVTVERGREEQRWPPPA